MPSAVMNTIQPPPKKVMVRSPATTVTEKHSKLQELALKELSEPLESRASITEASIVETKKKVNFIQRNIQGLKNSRNMVEERIRIYK